MTLKSNRRAIRVLIVSNQAESLKNSLVTEPFDANSFENSLTCSISTYSTTDLRARWNTMMRSLIGSEEALINGNRLLKDE